MAEGKPGRPPAEHKVTDIIKAATRNKIREKAVEIGADLGTFRAYEDGSGAIAYCKNNDGYVTVDRDSQEFEFSPECWENPVKVRRRRRRTASKATTKKSTSKRASKKATTARKSTARKAAARAVSSNGLAEGWVVEKDGRHFRPRLRVLGAAYDVGPLFDTEEQAKGYLDYVGQKV